MNGYEKHNAELKKPRTGHTLYDSTYMKLYNRRNYGDRNLISGCLQRGDGRLQRITREFMGEGNRNFYNLGR